MGKSDSNSLSAAQSYDAFISYKSEDLAYAEALYEYLAEAGFRVWFDKSRLDPGCNWHKEVETGCDASRVVLPVLTPGWKTSEWTRFETYGAEAVIPLHYEGTWGEVVTPPITRYKAYCVDMHRPGVLDFEKLIAAISRLLKQPAPDKGKRTQHLRCSANRYFAGREEELNQIHEALHRLPTAALIQGAAFTVSALGGVGKTTLARQYAERFWRIYPEMYWVNCRAGLTAEFARLADLLCPGLDTRDDNEKAAAAFRVLSDRNERLLILDNAEDEKSVSDWIPKSGGCRTLITSRFAGWSAAVKICSIDVLSPDQAQDLLLKRAGREESDKNRASADLLAEKLGYLPLALEQAAAFVAEEGANFTFGDYLKLYDQATQELIATGVLGATEYPDSVRTTWAATVNRLSPMPRTVLLLSSYLATAPIPMDMLVNGISIIEERTVALSHQTSEFPLAKSGPGISSAEPNIEFPLEKGGRGISSLSEFPEFAVRSAIKTLSSYSMVTPHDRSFSVHGLVQAVQRIDVPEAERIDWIKGALALVNDYAVGNPQDVRTWPIWDAVGLHAAAVAIHADTAGIPDPTARLMNDYGILLHIKCRFKEAELLYHRALAISEQSYGMDHPNVARDLNNLASLLYSTNRPAEAEPLMRRALAIFEKSLGSEHPSSKTVRSNLDDLVSRMK